MSVRAKFKVTTLSQNTFGHTVELEPVYDSDPKSENGRFYKATPGGKITLSTVNPEAALQFKPGDEFYVDFTKAG